MFFVACLGDAVLETNVFCVKVVCFEGNAGFYEMGCSGTPIECGYSVLGWNHPGFAGSTVSPA